MFTRDPKWTQSVLSYSAGTVAVFYVVSRAKDRFSRRSPVADLFLCTMGTAAPLGHLDLRNSQHGHRNCGTAFKSVWHGKPTRGLARKLPDSRQQGRSRDTNKNTLHGRSRPLRVDDERIPLPHEGLRVVRCALRDTYKGTRAGKAPCLRN